MKKRLLISFVLIVLGILAFGTISASAESGTCGTNLTWNLDSEGTLTISGEGEMTNWSSSIYVPWYSYRKSIKNVVIENGVTNIGNCAFVNCHSLARVTIGRGVINIGTAFSNCSSLESINVDENNQYYSSDENGILFNKDKTTLIRYPIGKAETSYIIPKRVTSIGSSAFKGCDRLESVTIGSGVKSIGSYTFSDCDNLESINVDENNQYYSSDENGILFNKDKTTLFQYPIGKVATFYAIPDSVTSIGLYAFLDCDSLTSITIPDSVIDIGSDAFQSCDSLANVTIGNGVTSIGSYAFSDCDSLTSITIPDSVTSIDVCVFDNCYSLESVTIGSGVTNIDVCTFAGCDGLVSIAIPESITSIGDSAFEYCDSLATVYYNGTVAMWNKISIGSNNTPLSLAEIICTPGRTMSFDGAQIRTESPQGLRFVFSIPKAMYDMLEHPKSPSDTGLGFGSVVMPKKYLGDNELTKETEVTLNGRVYKSKIAPAVNLFDVTEDDVKFTACLIDIPEKNYEEEYVAVPYMTYIENGEEITVYGEKTEGITVFTIAEMAYADNKTSEVDKEYLYNNILSVVDPQKYPTNK